MLSRYGFGFEEYSGGDFDGNVTTKNTELSLLKPFYFVIGGRVEFGHDNYANTILYGGDTYNQSSSTTIAVDSFCYTPSIAVHVPMISPTFYYFRSNGVSLH